LSEVYKEKMTDSITFKHCGICGKLVKEKDGWVSIALNAMWGKFSIFQMYHNECYDKEKIQ